MEGLVYSINYGNKILYIGSCLKKNYGQRKRSHRCQTINENHPRRQKKIHSKLFEIGFDNCVFKIEAEIKVTNQEELRKKEEEYIRKFNIVKNGFNGQHAYRTDAQYRIDNKEKLRKSNKLYEEKNKDKIKKRKKLYYEKNKDEIKKKRKIYKEKNRDRIRIADKLYREKNEDKLREKKKLYREKNKVRLREYEKNYREKNKDKIKERCRLYREKNKDKIKEKSRDKIKCDACDCYLRKDGLSKHKKTLKHKKYLNQMNNVSGGEESNQL